MTVVKTAILAAFSLSVSAASVNAATLGQYTFEENNAGFSTTSIGTQALDSSGNNQHFTKAGAPGTMIWSGDVAPVQPSGTTSLNYNAANALETPSQDLSFFTNPELTVEFWYKANTATTLHWILDTGNGANTWDFHQEFPGSGGATAGTYNFQFNYTDNAGTVRSINTATEFSTNSATFDWDHIAITVNRISGDISIYFNGVEDAATLGDENIDSHTYGAFSNELRMGQINDTGQFSNNMFIDDLRISDVELLAGDGSGDGVLAWNASLIPEPGSLALLGLGGAMVLVRRRADRA